MGLSAVQGVGEAAWARIEATRAAGPFTALSDFCRRTRLPQDVVTNLIRAGALDALGLRRSLLWQLGSLDDAPDPFDLETPLEHVPLPELAPLEQIGWEYELLGFSPDGHLLRPYRAGLRKRAILSVWQVKHLTQLGERLRGARRGVVRSRLPTAKGTLFVSLEDESGLLDLVGQPNVCPAVRPVFQATTLMVASGLVQRSANAASLRVQSLRRLLLPALLPQKSRAPR
jgi:error-prone DNA polymerase